MRRIINSNRQLGNVGETAMATKESTKLDLTNMDLHTLITNIKGEYGELRNILNIFVIKRFENTLSISFQKGKIRPTPLQAQNYLFLRQQCFPLIE